MNKLIAAITAALLILSLAACNTAPAKPAADTSSTVKSNMHIDHATLTQQEKDIAFLVGGAGMQVIFDFVVDSNVRSFEVSTYKLVDGAWENIMGGRQEFTDAKGRLALDFDKLDKGLRVVSQSDSQSGGNTYTADSVEDYSGIRTLTTTLDGLTEITYGQEIPLVMQLSSPADIAISGELDNFFTPAEIAKRNYKHVYAVTIRFDTKTVSELDS